MNESHRLESAPSGPEHKKEGDVRPEFGFSGTKQLQEMDAKIEDLTRKLAVLKPGGVTQEDVSGKTELFSEIMELQNELDENNLEREVFLQEHDNAGAFKMKRFNEGFMNMFEDGRLSINENKELQIAESEENRRMAVVNVGELARFNKEGKGHEAGNKILNEAVKVIDIQVMDKLKAMGKEDVPYSIYRFSGNEYMVDIQDIDQADLTELIQDIVVQQPALDRNEFPGVTDPAPLAVAQTSFAEMVQVYNGYLETLSERETVGEQKFEADEKTVRRDAYGIMKDIANYELDVQKFVSRTSRVKEMIDRHGVDGKGAQDFFDNYMKKMFSESGLTKLSDFEGKTDLEIYDEAFEWSSKMLGNEYKKDQMVDEIAEAFGRRVIDRQQVVQLPDKFAYASGEEVHLATVTEQTKGQVILAEYQENEDAAENKYKSDPEAWGAKHKWAMAKLENRKMKAGRDLGTGLLERGVYYNELTEALQEGEKETSVIFVDMGFLKYFDHAGGSDVGDSALKMAADLMEKAIDEAELTGAVYRYGGDEFTVRLDGGQSEVTAFNKKLHELKVAAGAIPAGKRGHEGGYYPTPLEFNFGEVNTADLEEAMNKLEENGLLKEGERNDPKRKAEIMTAIADKMIEAEKAVQRFELLITQLEDERYWSEEGNEDYKTHVNKLIEFSDKGIYGEHGGRDTLRDWAQSISGGADRNQIRLEIMQWVGEQVSREKSVEGEKWETIDQIIEKMIRDRFSDTIKRAEDEYEKSKELEKKREQEQEDLRAARGDVIDS